jgi:antitoxin component YwqK of YwqJK toxin-antitoxin module
VDTWVARVSGVPTETLSGCAYLSTGQYIAVGTGGTILTSATGETWTRRATPVIYWMQGIAQNSTTVVVAGGDAILYADLADLSVWNRSPGVALFVSGVAYGNGLFVAVGQSWNTPLATSPDGITWTAVGAGITARLRSVAFGDGVFVAVGQKGVILSSPDGTNWTVRVPATDGVMDLLRVTYGNGRFVAGGPHGTMRTSEDGNTWSDEFFGTSGMDILGAGFSRGWFVAAGQFGRIQASQDGRTWTERDSGLGENGPNLSGVASGGDSFVVVGDKGTIMQSGALRGPPELTITIDPVDAGTTDPEADITHAYATPTTVNLTATAASGYRFVGWGGDAIGSNPSLPLLVDSRKAVTAKFEQKDPLAWEGPLLNVARMGHATAVLDSGRVAVFGGHGEGYAVLSSMEVWDPVASTFTLHPLAEPFDDGAIVRLADGRILLAGGGQNHGVLPGRRTAQVYDPTTHTAVATAGSLTEPRVGCRGAGLASGKALLVGGTDDAAGAAQHGELYNPVTDSFSATGPLAAPRTRAVVLPVADGGAIVAGGRSADGATVVEQVERYNPATNEFITLSEVLFVGESGWELLADTRRDVGEQRTTDGLFVFAARKVGTGEVALALFNSGTQQFTRLPLAPPLPRSSAEVWPPLLNRSRDTALFLLATRDATTGGSELWPVSASLVTGKRTTSPVTVNADDYWVGGAAVAILESGQAFVTGGTTRRAALYNFKPVRNTLFVSVGITSGSATVIDRDRYSYGLLASNQRLLRDSTGALYVGYMAGGLDHTWGNHVSYLATSTDGGMSWATSLASIWPLRNLVVDSLNALYLSVSDGWSVGFAVSPDGGAAWRSGLFYQDWFGDWAPEADAALASDGVNVHAAWARSAFFNRYANYGPRQQPPTDIVVASSVDQGASWSGRVTVVVAPSEAEVGQGYVSPNLKCGPYGSLLLSFELVLPAEARQKMVLAYSPSTGWGQPNRLSDAGRDGFGGDMEVDSQGRLHVVWLERNTSGAIGTPALYARLWYAVYDPAARLLSPPKALTDAAEDVVSATLGVYSGDRILVAYDLHKPGTQEPGGVFGLWSGDSFVLPMRLTDSAVSRCPGLRSSYGMVEPSVVDLTWVEPDPKGGERLLYRQIAWEFLAAETSSAVLTSSVPDASFILAGPRVYVGTTGAEKSYTINSLPIGVYTATWGDVEGYAPPAEQSQEIVAGRVGEFAALYPVAASTWLTVAVEPADAGTVNVLSAIGTDSEGRRKFIAGKTVTVTATAAAGFRFFTWTGSVDVPSAAAAAVVMDGDRTAIAHFVAADQFFVTTAAGEHGSISPPVTVLAGDSTTVTVTPDAGYEVADVLVDGVAVGAVAEYDVEAIAADHRVEALFARPRRSLPVDVQPPGAGRVEPNQATYADGDTAQLTASGAALGWTFSHWSGAATGTDPLATVVVDADSRVTAHFVSLAAGILPGDVTRDGLLDILDAEQAMRMSLGIEPADLLAGDLTYDGVVGTADATRILRAAVTPIPLSSTLVEPGTFSRYVEGVDGIRIGLPPGLPTTPEPVMITAVDLDPPSPSGQAASPRCYRLTIGALTSFVPPVLVEMPVDPLFADTVAGDPQAAVWVGAWDEASRDWVSVDAGFDPVRQVAAFLAAGPLTVRQFLRRAPGAGAKVSSRPGREGDPPPGEDPFINDYNEGDYFQFIYNPRLQSLASSMRNATMGGVPVPESQFVTNPVAPEFQRLYLRYQTLGYPVKRYARSRPTWFGVDVPSDSRASVTLVAGLDGAEWSSWTGNYSIATTWAGLPDLQGAIGHELFHMVQNQTWTIASMAANMCLMDMTAEYARARVALTQDLRGEYTIDFIAAMMENGFPEPSWLPKPDETPPEGADQNHRYAMAHFLDFLMLRGANFPAMYTAMRASVTAHRNWAQYVYTTTGRSLENHYREFLLALLTDANWSNDRVPRTPLDSLKLDVSTRRYTNRLPAWVSTHDESATATMRVPADVSMLPLAYRLVNGTGASAVPVVVEVIGGVPNNTLVDVSVLPLSTAVPGGVRPLATFYPGQPRPLYTVVPLVGAASREAGVLYLTTYGTRKGQAAVVRLSPLQLTMCPPAIPAAALGHLYSLAAEVRGLPPAVKAVEVIWNFGDGSDDFSFYKSYPAGPPNPTTYSVVHRFANNGMNSFDVTFTLRDRTLNRVLVQGVCKVDVPSGTRLTFDPAVIYTHVGATVLLDPAVNEPPLGALYTWDFGDGAAPVTNDRSSTSHVYADQGTYLVSLTLADANGGTRARNGCRVVVEAVPGAGADTCDCGEGLDYGRLRHQEESEGGTDQIDYYTDGSGHKQGQYQVHETDAGTEYLAQCRCYVHDKLEGWWVWYHSDGSKAAEEYYVAGMRNGPWRGWSRSGTLLWESNWVDDVKEGPDLLLDEDGVVFIDVDLPQPHLDGSFTEYWTPVGAAEPRKKLECSFAAGLRQGPYSRWYEDGGLEQTGEFNAGVRTGEWIYRSPAGGVTTINYGEP